MTPRRSVSRRPRLFSSARGTQLFQVLQHGEHSPEVEEGLARSAPNIIQMDPPSHTELRNLMNVQFKPKAVQETEAHMRKIVCETLDRASSGSF